MVAGTSTMRTRADAHEVRCGPADVGPGGSVPDHGGEDAAAQPVDRVDRGLLLRTGRGEGDQARDPGALVDPRGRDGDDPPVGRHGLGDPVRHGRVARGIHGDHQGAVGPRAEALGREVVGPALGAAARQRTVRDSHPQREHRRRSGQQQPGGDDRVRRRVPVDVPDPPVPPRSRGGPRCHGTSRAEPVDPRSGQAEEGGQQRERGDHHDEHDEHASGRGSVHVHTSQDLAPRRSAGGRGAAGRPQDGPRPPGGREGPVGQRRGQGRGRRDRTGVGVPARVTDAGRCGPPR